MMGSLGSLDGGMKKPFACTVCSRTFNSKYNVVRHLKQFHAERRAFKCQVCGRDYKWIDSLHKHMKLHRTIAPTAEDNATVYCPMNSTVVCIDEENVDNHIDSMNTSFDSGLVD